MSKEITKSEFDTHTQGMKRNETTVGGRTIIYYSDPSTSTQYDLYHVDGRYFAGAEWLQR